MKTKCTVCNHPLIADINLAILSGDYTLDDLSDKFGPSRYAFHRHKGHLEKKIRRSRERLENHCHLVSYLKLSAILDHVEKRVEAAAAAEDTDRVFKGAQVGSRLIHQINKMDVHLELDTVYRLLSAPGAASRDSLLPHGPRLVADLHQALMDQATAPCPNPAEDEADEAAEIPDPDQPDLETEINQLLTALESPTPPETLHSQPETPCPPLETRNSELETPTDHCPLTTDHYLAAPAPPPNRNETATTPPRRPRQLPKMLRHRNLIVKAKKFVQHLGFDRQSDMAPAQETAPVPPDALDTPLLEPSTLLETRNPEPETAFSHPSSLIPDPCLLTRNSQLETPLLETPKSPTTPEDSAPLETRNSELETPPDPRPPIADPRLLERTADELFEIAHGYKRHNPPKHIPDRRRDEDFRSHSVFGDVKNVLKQM